MSSVIGLGKYVTDKKRHATLNKLLGTLGVKMKRRIYLMTLLLLIIKPSFADEYFPFVEFTCIPEANYLKVSAEGFYNIGAYKKETEVVEAIEKRSTLHYVGWNNPLKKSCTVNGKRIEVELNYRKPQARGECGGEERGALQITIDGLKVIDGARFHSECFTSSVKTIDFSTIQYGHFKVCGRYTERKPYKNKNVCAGVHLRKVKEGEPVNVEALLKKFSADY